MSKHTTLDQLKMLALRTKAEIDKIEVAEYSLTKQATAEDGYLATYQLTKDSVPVGEKINIPKDFLVKSADIKEVETADQPYSGAQVGDKYIDFVINSLQGDANESHVYLAVNELVDTYTNGNGIDISSSNKVSVKIDTANANGLGVGANGVKLDLATTTTAGAMSAADKTKLDGIETATDPEVESMLDEVFGAAEDAEGGQEGA